MPWGKLRIPKRISKKENKRLCVIITGLGAGVWADDFHYITYLIEDIIFSIVNDNYDDYKKAFHTIRFSTIRDWNATKNPYIDLNKYNQDIDAEKFRTTYTNLKKGKIVFDYTHFNDRKYIRQLFFSTLKLTDDKDS